ncbi:MAG: DUF711 family protein [Candidatus Paceibacterota bacterium]|jgi:hypothetical protein
MNIKIRTITLQSFLSTNDENLLKKFTTNLASFEKSGYSLRTYRILADLIGPGDSKKTEQLISNYVGLAEKYNFWGIGLPFDVSGHAYADSLALAAYASKLKDNIFINFVPVNEGKLHIKAITKVADFIIKNTQNPIDNFRVGVSSGKIKSPFFPFACAERDAEFIVGVEMVGYLTELVKNNNRLDLDSLRELLISSLVSELQKIQDACLVFEKDSGVAYGGMDISLAPYPYPLEDQSIVSLIEEIGQIGRSRGESVFEFGSNGTHFINTYLTNILKFIVKESKIKTTGFNGIMYSVLEDTYLSKRYEEGAFDLNFLKLLSTTCGCGVDMVPLSGAVKDTAVVGLIMDVLSTSIVLKKPLGVRVLPVPGLRSGERTDFKHLFFANTKVKEDKEGVTLQYLPHQQDQFTFLG